MLKLSFVLLFLGAMILVPVLVYENPLLAQKHTLDWYVSHTPKCWGPLCVDVYYDHVLIEFRLPV